MRVAPDDPRLDEVWQASAKHRKPVVIHCGPEPASGGYGIDVKQFSGADKLRRALRKHPGAIAIVPHLGVDQSVQFEAMLAEFPNLYLDTAMVIGTYFEQRPDIEMLRRHPDRILYGTDFPNLPYAWDSELAALRALKLPPGDEAMVLCGNALRLFQ
jgi:predicted TIM-barrel fold metal-dependent hydrolase